MEQLRFIPFPVLKTERLVLRQLRTSDDTEIFALRSDDRVNTYLDRPKATTIEEARGFIEKINRGVLNHEWLYWAITFGNINEPGNSKLIGTICLWNISLEKECAETGYELKPSYHGKGIMQEAFAAVLDFGFMKLGLKRIEAWTHKDNAPSAKLLEKFSFKRDYELEKEMGDKEELKFMTVYSLTRAGEGLSERESGEG